MSMTQENSLEASLKLIEKSHAIIQIEKLLTETLEHVDPWLPQTKNAHNNVDPNRPRIRPIPRSLKEAETILSVARNLSARTSAPAGWNPNAPVVGFSTPSPLPHHLRGGALAALQLERARQIEREKKRQRMQQQQNEMQQKQKHKQKPQSQPNGGGADDATDGIIEANRRDTQHQLDQARMEAAQRNANFQQQQRVVKSKQDVSMNLSDDDSDSDDD